MTRADFTLIVERQLQQQGAVFDRADLLAFVAGAWPWIEDDPDPVRWARQFTASNPAPERSRIVDVTDWPDTPDFLGLPGFPPALRDQRDQ